MRKSIDFPKRIKKIDESVIDNIVSIALHEDLLTVGDLTTKSLLEKEKRLVKAFVFSKEFGMVCGIDFFKKSFLKIDENVDIIIYKKDGEEVNKGENIAEINGNAFSLLTAERTALNFLGFLSGIATKVNFYTKLIKSSPTKILDTRKTLPGLRVLEKYAVATGGGFNHRYGLYDMILIKENHIYSVGSIKEAVKRAKDFNPNEIVEVEIQNLNQIEEVLNTGAEIVMLDNMNNDQIKKAFQLLKDTKFVEVSGNVNKERLVELADIGVDFVSMGELTHTIKPLDISMIIKEA